MSNRPRLRPKPTDALATLRGLSIPGGCPDCNAYQRARQSGGIWRITVYHDDACPYLNRTT